MQGSGLLMPKIRKPGKESLKRFGTENMLPLFIVAMAIVATAIEPKFATVDNLLNLARQIMPLLILATGQAFAIISGGLDLSLAAVMSLSGVVGVLAMADYGPVVGVLVMVMVGVTMGLVSGSIIAYFQVSPLVVTLGTLSVAQALALILSGGVPIYSINQSYADFVGFGYLASIPVTVWVGCGCALVGAF